MSDLDGLIKMIPVGDIAKKLGIDENTARTAIAVAVPAIVGGLAANANHEDGAKSLESALVKHEGASTDLADIDEDEGKKIVTHVFGSKQSEVVEAVAQQSGGVDMGAIVAQVLPIIAPIVLSFVATQFLTPKEEAEPTASPEADSGGGIGAILGGLLQSPETQNLVGGLLGGLLGGGRK